MLRMVSNLVTVTINIFWGPTNVWLIGFKTPVLTMVPSPKSQLVTMVFIIVVEMVSVNKIVYLSVQVLPMVKPPPPAPPPPPLPSSSHNAITVTVFISDV